MITIERTKHDLVNGGCLIVRGACNWIQKHRQEQLAASRAK